MDPIIWKAGASVTVDYQRGRMDEWAPTLPERTYTLNLDGAPVASATVGQGVARFAFKFTAPMTPGWRTLTVTGLGEGETQITYFAAVNGAHDGPVPVVQSSLELSQRYTDSLHAWAWVPQGEPVARPTPDHDYVPVKTEAEQTSDMLVAGDAYPPTTIVRNSSGLPLAMHPQAYYWDQIVLRGPNVLLHDGPRGVGTLCFTTHIEVGRATQTEDPASAPRKNVYACDPWRFVRVSNTGEVTTLAGWRGSPGAYTLVGDWSAVPADRRGFKLLWGMCWDSRTLTVDPSLPAVDGRPPHAGNPRAYVADSMRDRICRVEFDGKSHDTPAKVSEVFNGKGAWDCVEDGDTMIVSLRTQHKVVRMTFDGEVIDTIIERDTTLPGDAGLDQRHIAWLWSTTLEQAQAQPILAPEGLYVLDGLLYVGSRVMQQIVVVDLATKRIVRRVPVKITGNSAFVKLAVSDGSYAPRGTIFYATFDVQEGGRWYGIKPDGSRWNTTANARYPMDSYQMSFGIGGGRMIAGGSDYGLIRFYNGPAVDAALYGAGESEFKKMHGRLVYGPHGVGRFALPADASNALRYFVACNYGATQ